MPALAMSSCTSSADTEMTVHRSRTEEEHLVLYAWLGVRLQARNVSLEVVPSIFGLVDHPKVVLELRVSTFVNRRAAYHVLEFVCLVLWAVLHEESLNNLNVVSPRSRQNTSTYFILEFVGLDLQTGRLVWSARVDRRDGRVIDHGVV
jgi:hypothetical protein